MDGTKYARKFHKEIVELVARGFQFAKTNEMGL